MKKYAMSAAKKTILTLRRALRNESELLHTSNLKRHGIPLPQIRGGASSPNRKSKLRQAIVTLLKAEKTTIDPH